ncbi:MAG: c-type cytochrome domain-containing protein [Saprospiraceae bacterium]
MFQKIKYIFPVLVFSMGIWLSFPSCKHEPLFEDPGTNPIDTTSNPIDTMPVDTNTIDTTNMGVPCDSNVVYFDLQVLPILQSNCAFSGCHDAASAQDGVILEDYESVMQTAEVEPFDLGDSELYEVLVENDLDDRMPPAPTPALDSEQINIIASWILQGAQDLECNPNFGGCDIDNVSYSDFVKPLLQTHCNGCHSGNSPSGGIDLTTHTNVAVYANNGKLYGAIAHEAGFEAMPQGAAQLDDCTIDKIKSWIDAGALDN